MSTTPILSRPVDLSAIPSTGIERKFSATESERAALAKALGLVAVNSLSADLVATAGKRGSFRVEGRVQADIVQTCVVSLAPVPQKIDETIDVRFAPGEPDDLRAGAEIEIDIGADDAPEPLQGSSLDLGAVAEEHFVLAIDPYPRAPGAELEPAIEEIEPVRPDSPFAALAGLRGKSGGGA
jgi:uncharacterized metal-binding protein YceD (DUF177 family)